MIQPSMPLFADPPISVGPVPTHFVAASLTIEGKPMVGLQVSTAAGSSLYFLDPEAALALADSVRAVAGRVQVVPVMPANAPVGLEKIVR